MKKLVLDVGMHEGQDTILYLSQGYRVVAVEANPVLAKLVESRLSEKIVKGDLVVENVGISSTESNALLFYQNLSKSEWSSFNYDAAHKMGSKVLEINVRSVKFESLIEKYGIPFYLKIDIESYDIVCLNSLLKFPEKPKYISCEASSIEILERLKELGYSQFKLINQSWFHKSINLDLEERVLFPYFSMVINIFRKRLRHFLKERYPVGSSGPFGEDAHGKWLSFEEAKILFEKFYSVVGPMNNQSWFDIHAKIAE